MVPDSVLYALFSRENEATGEGSSAELNALDNTMRSLAKTSACQWLSKDESDKLCACAIG